MVSTYNLCRKLIDAGKADKVNANIDLYKLNNRLTDDEYTKLIERLNELGIKNTAE